jgi:hypothetical protein
MSSYKRVLLIEFNELSPTLLSKWMDEGHLPNFARFRAQSEAYVTSADVADSTHLEPWVQWYSLHTGLSHDQHGVSNLTDGPRADHADIFQLLTTAGRSVGCGGSMNVKAFAKEGSFFIADPWCDGQPAYPEELNTFQNFCAQQVREYSNPDGSDGAVSKLDFAKFMATNGVSLRTLTQTTTQLASEVLKNRKLNWRRPFILDRVSLDVFRHQYKRTKPDFATFFSNSTAHLQHTYWRHMDPEVFTVKPATDELPLYQNAIRSGYENMDVMLGEIMDMAADDDLLIFATALSQQPFLRREADGGQHFYRPRNMDALMQTLGIQDVLTDPVMTHQYVARFKSLAEAEAGSAKMSALTMNGIPVFECRPYGDNTVYFGCQHGRKLAADTQMQLGDETMSFFDSFYQIEAIKSGSHHPDGTLWIRSGTHKDAGRCSILDVFPTIMTQLGHENLIASDRHGKNLMSPANT